MAGAASVLSPSGPTAWVCQQDNYQVEKDAESLISEDYISIEGPVELIDGQLTLRIPLAVGGSTLAPLASKIGRIEGDFFCVVILPWLAEKLRIEEGSLVFVDNKNGKFTITRSAANDA